MICRFADAAAVSRSAADLFVAGARVAVAARGRFSVVLSGGRTPEPAYALLGRNPWRDRTPWPGIHLFWGDERCVPPEDARSNAGMARRALLDHVPVAPQQVHPIACTADPAAGAARYDQVLHDHFALPETRPDLVFLGLGADGHTASLFPANPIPSDAGRWAIAVRRPGERIQRVSLTPALINAARVVLFLVVGKEKAAILDAVIGERSRHGALPARTIKPSTGQMIWMVDDAAAAALPQNTPWGPAAIPDAVWRP